MTAEVLRELVDYSSETGVFRSRKTGEVLGSVTVDKRGGAGHIRIAFYAFGGFGFLAHRLAWLYVTGSWPKGQIDHKNLIKHDNRFENLREATNSENQANRGLRPHNTSGITGVSFHPSQNKWYAELSIDGVRLLHAYFKTKEEAVRARSEALNSHREFRYGG